MDNKKHPHYDLIVEWAKDMSKKWQYLYDESWFDCGEGGPVWDAEGKYREKPREFIKGHWYPCVDSGRERSLYYFNGDRFYIDGNQSDDGDEVESMLWIGKSLGEIKFNE